MFFHYLFTTNNNHMCTFLYDLVISGVAQDVQIKDLFLRECATSIDSAFN